MRCEDSVSSALPLPPLPPLAQQPPDRQDNPAHAAQAEAGATDHQGVGQEVERNVADEEAGDEHAAADADAHWHDDGRRREDRIALGLHFRVRTPYLCWHEYPA